MPGVRWIPRGHIVRANARRSGMFPWKSPNTYAGDFRRRRRGSAARIWPRDEVEYEHGQTSLHINRYWLTKSEVAKKGFGRG